MRLRDEIVQHGPALVLGMTVFTALVLAWAHRFIQDDAFISFRYARNLADGFGLVYNPGEPPIEGYTNFLWTVCLAPAFLLHVNVVAWSRALSFISFGVTLFAVARLARIWFGSVRAQILALALLAANYSFSSYVTGGLETQFGIAGILLAVLCLQTGRFGPAALCSACAVMTRMDAVLLLAPFWISCVHARQDRPGPGFNVRATAICCAGCVLPLAAWLFWRHGYYGAWVPNTFLVKGECTPLRGVVYILFFYGFYGWWLVLVRAGSLLRAGTPKAVWAALLLWHVYVVTVGGDFMEFRLLMPSFPFLALAGAGMLARELVNRRRGAWALAGLLIAFQLFGGIRDGRLMSRTCGVDTIAHLERCVRSWDELGHRLCVLLPDGKGTVRIGISAAGAIPFETGFSTFDVLGLNNREVALHGQPAPRDRLVGNRAGHVRLARWEQIQAAGVNLLICHPWIVDAATVRTAASAAQLADACPRPYRLTLPDNPAAVPPIIAWPVETHYWLMFYIRPTSAIDAAIRKAEARIIY